MLGYLTADVKYLSGKSEHGCGRIPRASVLSPLFPAHVPFGKEAGLCWRLDLLRGATASWLAGFVGSNERSAACIIRRE